MAARIRHIRHQNDVREKIRASQIVNTLENHIFGKHDLQASQVTAALGLLKKCVPDLSATEVDVRHTLDGMSDEELDAAIAHFRSVVGLGRTGTSAGEASPMQSPSDVSTLQ